MAILFSGRTIKVKITSSNGGDTSVGIFYEVYDAGPEQALVAYDPLTRTEATSDKNEITTAITALSDIDSAGVMSACTSSLNSYDPPTRAEATADKQAILDRGGPGAWTTATALQIQQAAADAKTKLTIIRGDDLDVLIPTGLDLTGVAKMVVTVKTDKRDADAAARLQVDSTIGLVLIDGAAGTAGNATLTDDGNPAAKNARLTLKAVEAAKLPEVVDGAWDIQITKGDGTIVTPVIGKAVITADVTLATS